MADHSIDVGEHIDLEINLIIKEVDRFEYHFRELKRLQDEGNAFSMAHTIKLNELILRIMGVSHFILSQSFLLFDR